MLSPHRVIARFLQADTIGDPKDLLATFTAFVEKIAEYEERVEQLRDILKEAEREAAKTEERAVYYDDDHPIKKLAAEWKKNGAASDADHWVASYGFNDCKEVGDKLFLAILQALSLPPNLTKKVQAASRFWSKSKVVLRKRKDWWARYFYWNEAVEAYPKFLSDVREQVAVATEAIEKGRPHTEAEDTRVQAGPFTLINTGNFKPEIMERVREVVEKSAKAMTSAGFGKVCYGDVHVTNTIWGHNILAFYLLANDEMFVRANVKPNIDSVHTVCHELAHRLQNKFLKGKQSEIDALYRQISNTVKYGEVPTNANWPEVGREIEYKGEALVVLDVDQRANKIRFGHPPAKSLPGIVMRRKTYTAPFEWWAENIEGTRVEHGHDYKGFITNYAKKNPDENFAEMVAFYALGRLPKPLAEMLEPIIG